MADASAPDGPQTDEPRTVPAALRAAAARWPDRTAYVEGERTVSYAELLGLVEQVGELLVNSGACCGDRVILWGPNSIDWAVAALAVSCTGSVLVPVNSRYVGREVAELVERTGARTVIVHDGFLGRDQVGELHAAGVPDDLVICLDRLVNDARECEGLRHDDGIGPDDVADILFTSGTTGRSKGAISAHRQTIGVARAWADLAGVEEDDRYLVVNPFFHSFGYKIGIVVGLLTGCTLYPVATFDVDATLALIESQRITVLPGAPAIFSTMLRAPQRAEHDLSSLRLAVTGAATIPVVLIEQMRAPTPAGLGIEQVVTAFGMTEAVVVTMCRGDESAETVATTSGRAIEGMETRIADPDDSGAGELLVRGDFVMLGYLDDPAATAEAIDDDGWLHTGDVGTLDADGNLAITDRLKDMYICGGFNVYPAEVEQQLACLDGIAEAAVVGEPDERLGEVGAAYVVRDGTDAGGALTEGMVIAFARERLANFKAPRRVVFLDALPRNLSGKVLKTELRS